MSTELLRRSLLDRRRGLMGWMLGLSAYCVLVVSIYPTVRDSAALTQAFDDYPDVLKEFFGGDASFDFASGAGFLSAEIYSLMLPLLLAVVAISIGASIGADQKSGLMDLILANPVSRRRVILERAAAMAASVVILAATVVATILVAGSFVDLGVGIGNLVAATLASVLLVLFHGLLALAAGAAVGNRSFAVGFATAVFAAGYLLSALGGLVQWLETPRVLSPYYHAVVPNPLAEGWPATNLAVLVAACMMALVAGVVLFDNRDIG